MSTLKRLRWEDIVTTFDAENRIRVRYGSKPHAGKQRFLNRWVRDQLGSSWQTDVFVVPKGEAYGLRLDFVKDSVALMVSFKHSSSLGLDLLAIQLGRQRGVIDGAILVTGRSKFLPQVTLRDAKTVVSFEKAGRLIEAVSASIWVPLVLVGIEF